MREVMTQSGAPPQMAQMVVNNMDFAANFPLLSDMHGGPDGTVWIQGVRPVEEMDLGGSGMAALEMGTPEWEVFDREGRLLGVVTLPADFRPLRFVGDDIYGVQRDDLDVQYVVRLRIERPTS